MCEIIEELFEEEKIKTIKQAEKAASVEITVNLLKKGVQKKLKTVGRVCLNAATVTQTPLMKL